MYDYTEKSQNRNKDKVIVCVCVNLKTEVVFCFFTFNNYKNLRILRYLDGDQYAKNSFHNFQNI